MLFLIIGAVVLVGAFIILFNYSESKLKEDDPKKYMEVFGNEIIEHNGKRYRNKLENGRVVLTPVDDGDFRNGRG